MISFLALVALSALIAEPTLCAPQRDLYQQQTLQSYDGAHQPSEDNSPNWDQDQHTDQSNYQNLADSNHGANFETFTENDLNHGVVHEAHAPSKPENSWHDSQHFVTNDGKGEANFQLGQKISDNGISKFAQHHLTYDSNADHTPGPNTQVLNTEEFQHRQDELQKQINDFIGGSPLGHPSVFKPIHEQFNFTDGFGGLTPKSFDQFKNIHDQFFAAFEQQQRKIQAEFETFRQQQLQQQRDFAARFNTDLAEAGQQQQLRFRKDVSAEHQDQSHLDKQIAKIEALLPQVEKLVDCAESSKNQFEQSLAAKFTSLADKLDKSRSNSRVTSIMGEKLGKIKSSLETYSARVTECVKKQAAGGAAKSQTSIDGNNPVVHQIDEEVNHFSNDLN